MIQLRAAVICFLTLILLVCLNLPASAQGVGFSPTYVNFGDAEGGESAQPENITLTNTGNATLNISGISITGADPQDFSQNNTCSSPLIAGTQCTITVGFKPTLAGARAANLSVADNASGSPQLVPLSGVGVSNPVAFSPPSLTFPDQVIGTTSVQQSTIMTYVGQPMLKIKSVAIAGANASDFSQTNTCGSGLTQDSTCTIAVTFTPSAAWTRSALIEVTDNGLGSPHLVGLAGSGVSGGVPSLSSSGLTFGNQLTGTSSAPQSVTLTNNGTASIGILSVTGSGDFAQSNNCGSSLAVGAPCTANVTFAPSSSGKRTGWITFNLTDPAGLQTVTLTGTGTVTPPLAVKPRAASVTPTQTQQYTAYVSGVQTANVTWLVDGVAGGNSTAGTISNSGLYSPPSAPGSHAVTAINNARRTQTASVPVVVSGYTGTLTYHNDNLRTGQNNSETALSTGNVTVSQFGKLFSQPVDGYVYAQPLWVPGVTMSGQGVHNVVYVATEHDSVYAFDADQPLNGPLWHTSFITAPGVTTVPRADIEVGTDLSPEAGITSAPVIDTTHGVMFVLARTKEVSGATTSYVHRLHALDITTGNDISNPVVIAASVPGTGYDNVGGVVTFAGLRQNNRSALLLANGIVYVAFASLEDIDPYHGWVLGYNETNLASPPVAVFNDTPNGQKGGIWQGGGGLLADSTGNIYLSTGNGTFDANVSGPDYGESFLKLSPEGAPLDYFTPFDQRYLSLEGINADLASSGPVLLPDQSGPVPHLALACGKTGTLYLMNRDNLGQYNGNSDQIQQALYLTIGVSAIPTGNWGTPPYFQSQIYIAGVKDPLKQFALSESLLSAGPLATGPEIFGYPGANPVISSNGSLNGIVWVSDENAGGANKALILRAYDAANVAHELYNSGQAGKRDTAGPAVKFGSPTVANGKVYVGTQTELDVYGLLP
jgi:hypothetical protein